MPSRTGAGSKGRGRVPLLCLALVVLLAVVFGQLATHPFASFDDDVYLTQNLFVQDGLTWRGLAWAFTTLHAANWHPLTWLSHMLDAQLYGMRPGLHHLTSLALHAGSTLALLLALRGLTGALWPSVLAAALFGVHPLHVESVAWLAERKDVISTLFWMLTLLAYLRYVRRPGRGRYLVTAALFAAGLLAKPMLVTLPLALLLLDAWPLGRMGAGWPSPRRAGALLLEKAPLLALAAASSVVTFIAQHRGDAVIATWRLPLSTRLANALVSYLRYVQKMLWPEHLAMYYPYPEKGFPAWQVAGAGLLLAAITVAVVAAWRRWPFLAVGWFWYLGTLVPVIGLVQVGMQGMADRYSYVPLVGLFIALAWGGARLVSLRPGAGVALGCGAVAAVAALSTAAWHQVGHWRDDQSLFGRAIEVTGANWLVQMNLAVALYNQGRYGEAVERNLEAMRLNPMSGDIFYNLGLCYAALGRTAEEVAAYEVAVRYKSGDADLQNNYGAALLRQGRFEEALARFREAVRLAPDDDLAHENSARILARLGRGQESAAAMARALQVRERRRAAHPSLAPPPRP